MTSAEINLNNVVRLRGVTILQLITATFFTNRVFTAVYTLISL